MNFKAFQLIIDEKRPTDKDVEKIMQFGKSRHLGKKHIYSIKKKLIKDRFLWLYCQYENIKLYGDIEYDTFTEEVNLRKDMWYVCTKNIK